MYDSMKPAGKELREDRHTVADNIRKWNQDEGEEDKGVQWEQVPQQLNQEDCGVAMLMAMKRRLMIRRRPRKVDDWGYAAGDLEKARWRIAKELESDRMWVTGEVTMTKRQRIMGSDS